MFSFPDPDVVDQLVHDTCAAEGFTGTDRAGEVTIDDDRIKDAVYGVMLNDHVVDDPAQMAKGAVTQHELYQAIFPKGPGAQRLPGSPEEKEAYNHLARKVWGYANAGTTGYVNKRVEAEGLTFVMCEAPVGRTYRAEETGRRTPKTEPGRFLTDNAELISTWSTLPRTQKLVKAAEATAKHLTMALRRHPELTPAVRRQISGALKQSTAALTAATSAQEVKALASGESEDDVA